MQSKLLKDVFKEIAGEFAGEVVDIILEKKGVNEFLIAKKLNLTINQTRNIFYKLSNFGLVSFTRKKDKRKGWYTYFWTLNTGRTLELLEEKLSKEIENLKQQLKNREMKRYYICNECKVEINEEKSLLHNFTCPECGEVYVLNEDKKIFNILRNKISRLEKQRENVLSELELVNEKKKKKIISDEKREKKKKEKIRKEEKIKRDKAKPKKIEIKKKSDKKIKKPKKSKKKTQNKTKKKTIKKKRRILGLFG
ncbi:MAG: hypothetical protein ABIG37_01110 [Nanoarchaeota archaeon]|nr:hypothetical protein [Nanoarchaeota archaeon]